MQKTGIDWLINAGKNEKLNIFHNAPTVIIVSARKNAVTPVADACAAIENMLLAAESLNIGSCWIGFARFFFNDASNYEKLKIPSGFEAQYAITLGYKKSASKMPAPVRKYDKYYSIIK
jgi:nitroreductase